MTDPAIADPPARPFSACALGAAGLVPFFGAALALWAGPANLRGSALQALLFYTATILSFLGGVRWGHEIARQGNVRAVVLIGAVAPAVAAWLLLILPIRFGIVPQLAGLMVAMAGAGVWDRTSALLPLWYRKLRLWLTIAAEAAILIGLVWAIRNA